MKTVRRTIFFCFQLIAIVVSNAFNAEESTQKPNVVNYASEHPEIVAELNQLHHNWAQDVNSH